jgi:methionyl-tRNA formyltransferase
MQMDEGLDIGDILLREDGIFTAGFDAGDMHDILAQKAVPLLLKTLAEIKNITPQKQSEIGVTYAKKISKEDCKIDWKKSAQEIHNQIRGLSPSPAAYFDYNNENIKICSSSFSTMKHSQAVPAGTVLGNHLLIACGEGILTIEEVQRPNKKRMFASEMLKSYPIPAGALLV